jgi:iron complex transport system ATP-binding protein
MLGWPAPPGQQRTDAVGDDARLAGPKLARETYTSVRIRNGDPIIEIENATVVEDGATLLQDVSLTIRKGEHVAILGPNGAGKTSLLRLLTAQVRPYYREPPSRYRIFDSDRWSIWELNRHLGVVTPEIELRNRRDLTAREVVCSGYFGTVGLHEALAPAQIRRVDRILRVLGLTRLSGRIMTTLSTGEARSIMIARALVHEPAALLLDEPTSGLDIRAGGTLLGRLRRLATHGTTLILATHHVEDIIPEVTRVALLQRGRILAIGSKESLLRSSVMSELYEVPVTVRRRGWRYGMEVARG